MSGKYIKRATAWFIVCALLSPFLAMRSSGATLDDLKKLEIACFVPSYLPHGFRLKTVEITYEDSNDVNHPLPLYSLEYSNGWSATFSVESAREGIGDRNLMAEENTEETEIPSAFGPMYLIYRPKGKDGRKECNENGLKQDGEWLRYSEPDTEGFMRYRVLESKGNHYKVEYQENGGGTLTTASTIEFDIEKRTIRRDGRPVTIRLLRVSSCNQK